MAATDEDDPLILLISELAKEFPEATVIEISEACAAPVSKVAIALFEAENTLNGSYRSELVAKMRARLAPEAA